MPVVGSKKRLCCDGAGLIANNKVYQKVYLEGIPGNLVNYGWFVIFRDTLKKLISPCRVIHYKKGKKIPARNDSPGLG